MAKNKLLSDTALASVIDDDATLDDGVRAAADYENGTALDISCTAYLTVQWNTTPPTAGDRVAELWVLGGDNAGVLPEGGDAGLGTDDDPQDVFKVGEFISINPSITVDEILGIPFIPLYSDENRFVLKNISGQQFDLTWQLDIKPGKFQTV